MSNKQNRKRKNDKRKRRKERKKNSTFEVIEGGKNNVNSSQSDVESPDLSEYTYDEWLNESYIWKKVRILLPLSGMILLMIGLIVMWFAPTIGWDALIASLIAKSVCSIGSLMICVPITIMLVCRFRYGANDTGRGKVGTAVAFIGLFLSGIIAFVSVGFTLLCIEDVAAGENEHSMAAATYAGHNTFLGTKVKAIALNADSTLIFCREGTDAYNELPDSLNDGDDLNVTLYGNSKTLIKVAIVEKKDESQYKIQSIVDNDNDNNVSNSSIESSSGNTNTADVDESESN